MGRAERRNRLQLIDSVRRIADRSSPEDVAWLSPFGLRCASASILWTLERYAFNVPDSVIRVNCGLCGIQLIQSETWLPMYRRRAYFSSRLAVPVFFKTQRSPTQSKL
jgi:hypothetical protein